MSFTWCYPYRRFWVLNPFLMTFSARSHVTDFPFDVKNPNVTKTEFKILQKTVASLGVYTEHPRRTFASVRLWLLFSCGHGQGRTAHAHTQGACVSLGRPGISFRNSDHKPFNYYNAPTHSRILTELAMIWHNLTSILTIWKRQNGQYLI